MTRFARTFVAAAPLAGLLVLAPESRADDGEAIHSPNLTPVADLAYADQYGTGANQGSDIEFARLKHKGKVKDFALAGALDNGLQIIDISNPSAPALVGRYDCGISQGDVQVFTRGSRTLATYTIDAGYTLQDSQCVREAKALGLFEPTTPHPLDIDPIGAIAPDAAYGRAGIGAYIVDITEPTKPRTVSFVGVPKGSHNQSVHPSFYNGGVRVVDISSVVGVALGGQGVGMKEIGFARFPDSLAWSAKTPRIAPDGSFHLFANDLNRWLDVFRFDPAAERADGLGTFTAPADLPAVTLASQQDAQVLCLINRTT